MSPDVAKQLRQVIERVLHSKHSDFYRQKFGIQTVPDTITTDWWQQIPFLERAEIARTPYNDRLYVPDEEVGMIRLTSGTSGQGVLLVPRNHMRQPLTAMWQQICDAYPITKIASFASASFRSVASFKRFYDQNIIALPASDIAAAAALVKAYSPDTLFGFGYAIEPLAKELTEAERSAITFIYLFGERNSELRRKRLNELYPKATIMAEYSSVDAQTIVGLPCLDMIRAGSQLVHAVPEDVYCEIIDTESGEVITETDVVGELVITNLQAAAFPLIRYRTGDLARFAHFDSTCGFTSPILSIEGRTKDGKVRFRGGELQLPELERAVAAAAGHDIANLREIHFAEEQSPHGLLSRLTLTVEQKNQNSAQTIADSIARELRVGPGISYADAVERNLVLPLTIQTVTESAPLKTYRGIVTSE